MTLSPTSNVTVPPVTKRYGRPISRRQCLQYSSLRPRLNGNWPKNLRFCHFTAPADHSDGCSWPRNWLCREGLLVYGSVGCPEHISSRSGSAAQTANAELMDWHLRRQWFS